MSHPRPSPSPVTANDNNPTPDPPPPTHVDPVIPAPSPASPPASAAFENPTAAPTATPTTTNVTLTSTTSPAPTTTATPTSAPITPATPAPTPDPNPTHIPTSAPSSAAEPPSSAPVPNPSDPSSSTPAPATDEVKKKPKKKKKKKKKKQTVAGSTAGSTPISTPSSAAAAPSPKLDPDLTLTLASASNPSPSPAPSASQPLPTLDLSPRARPADASAAVPPHSLNRLSGSSSTTRIGRVLGRPSSPTDPRAASPHGPSLFADRALPSEGGIKVNGNIHTNSDAIGNGHVFTNSHGHPHHSNDYFEIPSPADSDDMQLDTMDISLDGATHDVDDLYQGHVDESDHLDSTVASSSHTNSQHSQSQSHWNQPRHQQNGTGSSNTRQKFFDFSILRALRRLTLQRDDPPTPPPPPSPSPSLSSPISSPADTPTLINGIPDRHTHMQASTPGAMQLQPLARGDTLGQMGRPGRLRRGATAGGGGGGVVGFFSGGGSGTNTSNAIGNGTGTAGVGSGRKPPNPQSMQHSHHHKDRDKPLAALNRDRDKDNPNVATVCKLDNLRPFVVSRQRETLLINRVRDVALSADNDYVGIADSFWVLASLRARNGDVYRAIALLGNYLSWRRTVGYHDRIISGLSPAVRDLLRSGTFSVCGNCSVDGQPVLTIRYEYYEPSKYQGVDATMTFCILIEYLMRTFPRCQTHGLVVMEEMSGAKVKNLDIRLASFLSKAFSSIFPLRISAMFFCNAKRGVRTALRFMSPFLAKKFKTRVYVMHEGLVERFATYFTSDQTPIFMKMKGTMKWTQEEQVQMASTVLRECEKWPKSSTFRDSQ